MSPFVRPMGVPSAPLTCRHPLTRERAADLDARDAQAIAAARAAYDAALEAATDAAQERHHIDRNSAWWIAKGTVEVKVAARYLEKATAGAWIAAFWRNLTPVED